MATFQNARIEALSSGKATSTESRAITKARSPEGDAGPQSAGSDRMLGASPLSATISLAAGSCSMGVATLGFTFAAGVYGNGIDKGEGPVRRRRTGRVWHRVLG